MNKLQKFIVWLFKIPTTIKEEKIVKIINPEFKLPVEVIRIVDFGKDIELITELGITVERYDELCKYCKMYTGQPITDGLINISKQCKNPNELAVMCYLIGLSMEYYKNPINYLIK